VGIREYLSALTITGLFPLSAFPAPGAGQSSPSADIDRQTRTLIVASFNLSKRSPNSRAP
jgi:hypothetical protein